MADRGGEPVDLLALFPADGVLADYALQVLVRNDGNGLFGPVTQCYKIRPGGDLLRVDSEVGAILNFQQVFGHTSHGITKALEAKRG